MNSSSSCPMARPSSWGNVVILLKDRLSCRSDGQVTVGSKVSRGPTQLRETFSVLSESRYSSSTGSDWSWLPCRSSRVRLFRLCAKSKTTTCKPSLYFPLIICWWFSTHHTCYLAQSWGKLQQTVVAQVQTEEMSQLLLDEAIIHQTGQRVQLVTGQVQQADPLTLFGQSSWVLTRSKHWGGDKSSAAICQESRASHREQDVWKHV